jgi:uncharacterized protein YqfB (UPF0267 family)
MKVKIPFLERFRQPMIQDRKTWTSRTKRYGQAGDVFEVFGHEFEIVRVERRTVDDIMDHWQEEGCGSREDAQEVWSRLHPRRHDPEQRMFTHVFKRIS